VKALPVLDARQRVAGIITGGDLLSRSDMDLRLSINRELDAGTLQQRLRALGQSPKSARDVMSRHVHTVQTGTDLATVIRLMAEHNVKRLPVVNENKELVGLVSRADVLRAIAALPEPAEGGEHELPVAGWTVADAVITDVPVLSVEAPAEEVFERVLESRLRRAVVTTAEGTVLGLITDRDLLARSSPDRRAWVVRILRGGVEKHAEHVGGLKAADLMAPSLITVRPEDSLVHAIRLMIQHKVKRLVVVDDDGRLRGLVARREILKLLAGDRF
jgi:CBS domain-containing protein